MYGMEEIVADEQKVGDLTAKVVYEQDSSYMNPREDFSNVGEMVVDYRDYILGDEGATDPREHYDECPDCDNGYAYGHGPVDEDGELPVTDETCATCGGWGEIEIDPVEYLRREGARVIMPLYVYEHSGITIRAGSPIGPRLTREDVRSSGRFALDGAGWDTSMVGFVYDTPEGVRECIGDDATDEQIEKALDQEVETYAAWLEGRVFVAVVEDEDGDVIESVGGFIDDEKYAMQEAVSMAESVVEDRKRKAEVEARESALWASRGVMTVGA